MEELVTCLRKTGNACAETQKAARAWRGLGAVRKAGYLDGGNEGQEGDKGGGEHGPNHMGTRGECLSRETVGV